MIWTLAFWKGAGERALKTFFQSAIPAIVVAVGATSTGVLNVWMVPWTSSLKVSVGIGLGAAFLSLCTSLGNATFTAGATAPSVNPAAITPAPKHAAASPTVTVAPTTTQLAALPPVVAGPVNVDGTTVGAVASAPAVDGSAGAPDPSVPAAS